MITRSAVLSGVGFVFISSFAVAQQEIANVEITSTHVAKGIYMFEGRGGNMGLSVGADGAFLVDDQSLRSRRKSKRRGRHILQRAVPVH